MTTTLLRWTGLPESLALEEILPCNGSPVWALGMVRRRPFATAEQLFHAADDVWWSLDCAAWQAAFDSHPRIGERHAHAASAVSLAWSAAEQGTLTPEEAVRKELSAANRLYEQRFGRIFIVCATGKSASTMLSILNRRLGSDTETELRETAEQQRRITQLRLRRWLGLPALRCEDV